MKLLAIDGNSIINRAFYGIRLLTTKEGQYTNGIYGFLNILLKLIDTEKPDGVAVAFDLRSPTFRHKMYAEYKAGRKGMPEELASQMPLIKELLSDLGYAVLTCEGYEADDILGTLAAMAEEDPADTCVIATGDRDSLQLVSNQTKVILSATKQGRPEITECTPEYIAEKHGVTPLGMIEVKALMGDSSDNIPGVRGVGEKTADELIAKYGTLENIYDNIDSPEIRESLRKKLLEGKESAFLSRTLGTICRTAPIGVSFGELRKKHGNPAAAVSLMRSLELFSLIPKFGLDSVDDSLPEVDDGGSDAKPSAPEYKMTDSAEDLLSSDKELPLYCLFDGGFVFSRGEALLSTDKKEDALKILSSDCKKYFHDIKSVYEALPECPEIKNSEFDTLLAGYLLNPNGKDYSLARLSEEYSVKYGESVEERAAALFYLTAELSRRLDAAGMMPLLKNIEMPLAAVLSSMEKAGFLVNTEGIRRYGEELGERIEKLRSEIISDVGYEFNLNSPKQLGEALFVKMGLPGGKKTKSGYSTGAEILEGLKYESPTVGKLLEYRALTKLKSTYCDGLTAAAGPDGRIHSRLNQTETRTGRISSAEPNLQNIPVRKEEGRLLRDYFIADEGCVLCDADYSQIELRVLAHMANDPVMIAAFNNGADIHTSTAAEVFGMPPEMVTHQMRSRAKAVNFGIVYGIGAFSLAKDIGVSFGEASGYIKKYLGTYKGVDEFMKHAVSDAKENGYVTTMFARRRPLPEIKSGNGPTRSFGERAARNAPIQGTAADIIKIAMIKVWRRLNSELPEARLIMQVHDELIIEAPERDADKACRILSEEMEHAAEISVKLAVDVHTGKTWLEAKD